MKLVDALIEPRAYNGEPGRSVPVMSVYLANCRRGIRICAELAEHAASALARHKLNSRADLVSVRIERRRRSRDGDGGARAGADISLRRYGAWASPGSIAIGADKSCSACSRKSRIGLVVAGRSKSSEGEALAGVKTVRDADMHRDGIFTACRSA